MKTTAVNENQQSEVQTNMKAAVINAFQQQLESKMLWWGCQMMNC